MALSTLLLIVIMVAVQLLFVSGQDSYNIEPKDNVRISLFTGFYSVSFRSNNCPLILGQIPQANFPDIFELPTSIPSTFTIIAYNVSSYTSSELFSFEDPTYFVLFNNGSQSCFAETFKSTLEVIPLQNSSLSFTLPYFITKTFSNGELGLDYDQLTVNSPSSLSFFYSAKSEIERPFTTPFEMQRYSLVGNQRLNIQLETDPKFNTTYIYLKCASRSGCPVSLSLRKRTDYIGAIIGSLTDVIVLAVVVILTVVVVLTVLVVKRHYKNKNPTRTKLLP